MKKLMTSTIILLPLIILAILLVSGAIKALMTHIYVDRVEFVDNETLTLVMDDEGNPPSEQLEVNVFPLKAENRAVAFSMDDENIATVDASGKVVAKYYGTTTVTVTSVENKTKFAQKKVVVTDRRVHDIVIHDHAEEMYVGDDSIRLTAEVLPDGADNKNIEWSTDAPADVLTVDKTTGFVTCYGSSDHLEGGVATITATSVDDPGVTATTTIKCCRPLSGLNIQESGRVVTALKEAQFPEIVPYPADATYEVAYTASDSGVAAVNGEGKITFYKPGQVTVTATATDGRGNSRTVSKDYDCTFGYFAGPLFGTAEKQTYDYDTLTNGDELDISFTKTPADSYQEIVRVEFAGPDLIAYDEDSETFTFKEADDTTPLGTVTITVHAKKYGSNHAVEEFDSDRLEVEFTRKIAELKFESGGEALSSVSVTAQSINLAELKGSASGLGVRAFPENHTDSISYSCESTCASLVGTMLTFTEEGEATVTVSVGEVSATIKVSYAQPDPQDVTVTLDSAEEQYVALDLYEQDSELKGDNAVLVFGAPDGYEVKIESDCEEVIKVEGQKLVPQKGGFATVTVSFVPGAGAAVYALNPQTTYTVHVYVDKSLGAEDISFAVGNTAIPSAQTFTTAKGEVTLTITVDAKNGAMEGKDLYLDGAAARQSETQGDKIVYTKMVSFATAQDIAISATVQYAGTATAVDPEKTGAIMGASNSCRLHSTMGKITSGLAVTKDVDELTETGNVLTFDNLGEQIILNVKAGNPEPADFVLATYVDASAIEETLQANNYLDAEVEVTGNTATITLTAASAAERETLHLTIAGNKFELTVTVHVPADEITVEYGEGGSKVTLDKAYYTTFLSELAFRVTLSREDGKTGGISAAYKKIAVTFGGRPVSADNVTPDGDGALSFTVKVKPTAERQTLTVTAEGGLATFTVQLQKLTAGEGKFTYYITYTYGVVKDAPEPRFEIKVGEKNDSIFFPRGLRDFEIHIVQPKDDHRLGDFTDDAPTAHFRIKEEGWKCEYHTASGSAGYLTVTVPEGKEFFTDEEITFVCPNGEGGEAETTLTLTLPNVRSVSMTGYDNGVATDVYKGYQQVRVFAKHSDYGDGKGVVDYYRVPFTAEASVKVETAPGYAVWNISSHNDKTGKRKLLATQTWTTVTYYKEGGPKETYTIEDVDGPSTLKKGGTEIAKGGVYLVEGAEQVPWVDVFAEEGYAHIYFGNFAGLSETDIQNDLFGNFGEQTAWEVPYKEGQKNIEGKDITPSDGAFSYLRVAVGDGTVDSTQAAMEGGNKQQNTHFNFNVLADTDLYNVFNATGYYAHSKVVLHENLYGPSELTEDGPLTATSAAEQDLILTKTNESGSTPWLASDSNVLGKTIIYGNGYQVNFEAKTAQLKAHEDTGTSRGVYLQKAINTDVKASNPKDTITKTNQPLVMIMQYAYYSTIEYYSKISPWGAGTSTPGYIYLKNTVLRYCAQSALQLYYSTSTAYIENVVLNECVGGFTSDSKDGPYHVVYNFKGFVDILNYMSYMQLADSTGMNWFLGATAGFDAALQECDDYLEWLGKTPDKLTSSAGVASWDINPQVWWGTRFANVFLYNRSVPSHESTVTLNFWNESAGKYEGTGELENGIKVTTPIDMTLDSRNEKYKIFTYADTVNSDGGLKTDSEDYNDRDMNQLFSESRYIRVLCQYKSLTGKGYSAKPVKNYEHIQWHTNRVYRDYSLTGHEMEDHIENLKNSLVGVEWPDGTTPADAGVTAAAQMNALLSETVLPSKRAD